MVESYYGNLVGKNEFNIIQIHPRSFLHFLANIESFLGVKIVNRTWLAARKSTSTGG